MTDTSQARLEWHILTLEATPERARSIWQNEQLAFYRELVSLRDDVRALRFADKIQRAFAEAGL